MNRRWSALALSAVAMGALAVTATEASADPKDPHAGVSTQPQAWPDEGTGYPGASESTAPRAWPEEGAGYPGAGDTAPEYNYPNYDKRYGVTPVQPVQAASAASTSDNDDATAAVLQAGASALGGAGVAFGAMWVFRRHQRLAS